MNASELLELATRDVANSRHLAVWEWFYNCPLFTRLFFNFDDGENGNVIIAPVSIVKDEVVSEYVNGDSKRNYDFTVIIILPISVATNDLSNLKWVNIVEGIAEWVDEQEDSGNYPLFKMGQTPDMVEVIDNQEGASAIDENSVKYQFTVRIEYFKKGG